MLQDILQKLHQQNIECFVCLSGSAEAEKEWLQAGGSGGNLLSSKQVESYLMTGLTQIPKEIAFSGTLEEFVALFPKTNAAQSKKQVNHFLSGAVVEYTKQGWEVYRCQTVVMGCCMGEYLSIVNRKDLM